jgi:hypothetical protein
VLVELASLRDPGLVPRAIADAVHLPDAPDGAEAFAEPIRANIA